MATHLITYSFMNVFANLTGPGAFFDLGHGAGVAEEGITIEMLEDKDSMLIGADGRAMHSLHAGNAGTARVRLLKTSETNFSLSAAYNFQKQNSRNWGQNIIVIRSANQEDIITCTSVAFARVPTVTYAKEAGMLEWVFNCGQIEAILGAGTASSSTITGV